MALDWSPMTIPSYLMMKNLEQTGSDIGRFMLGPGAEAALGRPEKTAKTTDEFLRNFGQSYWIDELGGKKGDYKTYEEFAETNPLLKAVHEGEKFKHDDITGQLSHWVPDVDDPTKGTWQVWDTSGGIVGDTGEESIELYSPFGAQDKKSQFETYLDNVWGDTFALGGDLTYKTPRSMLGALLDPNYKYSGEKQDFGIKDINLGGVKDVFSNLEKPDLKTLPNLTKAGGYIGDLLKQGFSGLKDTKVSNVIDKLKTRKTPILDLLSNLPYKPEGSMQTYDMRGTGRTSGLPSTYNVKDVYGNQKGAETPNVYEVQSGDYLGNIASQHGLTLQEIIDLNPHITWENMNKIHPGQQINIGK